MFLVWVWSVTEPDCFHHGFSLFHLNHAAPNRRIPFFCAAFRNPCLSSLAESTHYSIHFFDIYKWAPSSICFQICPHLKLLLSLCFLDSLIYHCNDNSLEYFVLGYHVCPSSKRLSWFHNLTIRGPWLWMLYLSCTHLSERVVIYPGLGYWLECVVTAVYYCKIRT